MKRITKEIQKTMREHRHVLVIAIAVVIITAAIAIFTTEKGHAPIMDEFTDSRENSLQQEHKPTEVVSKSSVQPARYIEIIDSCGPTFAEACVHARSGPSTASSSVAALRSGIVLRISDTIENVNAAGEHETWHKVIFNEWVRYPDRLPQELYVSGKYSRAFEHDPGGSLSDLTSTDSAADNMNNTLTVHAAESPTKRIIVDLSEQQLYAYDGETLFMKATTSTGLRTTPTPRGIFTIYRKTPSRYMQGPIPGISFKEYDLPGVPWNLYFTEQGAVIHGAYWHNKFGQVWSNGCVNLPPAVARQLYDWAPLGTTVTIRD